jgi:CubicO group peptidase (beta-lactamase class C family)
MEEPTLDQLALRDAVRSYAMLALQFQPGTKYLYSNAGINTAARILEVVSGTAYEDFLDQRLFKPLGMTDTTFWPNEEQLARLAKSYKPNASQSGLDEIVITQLRYPLSDRKRQPVPAGGLFSTARDVAIFCQMILAGGTSNGKRYLSESAVKQMTSRQTSPPIPESYGFGWSVNGSSYGHGGAYATNMDVDPVRNLISVFLVQHAGFPGQSSGAIQKAFIEAVGTLLAK